MHHQEFNIQQFDVLPTQLYLCVLCGSENKQPLFPIQHYLTGFYNKDLTIYTLQVTICTTTSLTFNSCTLCPHCIYVFCIYLRTKSDLCHLLHKLIGFYNRDEKCLQLDTDWVFKYSGLRFFLKGLTCLLGVSDPTDDLYEALA